MRELSCLMKRIFLPLLRDIITTLLLCASAMGLTTILLAVIVILTLVIVHFRRKIDHLANNLEDCTAGRASTWGAIRESWAQLRGKVVNMVVAGDAGPAAASWVTKNAPHGKGGAMGRRDANTVCAKACSGWTGSPSVAVFCNCDTSEALDF